MHAFVEIGPAQQIGLQALITVGRIHNAGGVAQVAVHKARRELGKPFQLFGRTGLDKLGVILRGIDDENLSLLVEDHGIDAADDVVKAVADLGGQAVIALVVVFQHVKGNAGLHHMFGAELHAVEQNAVSAGDHDLHRAVKTAEVEALALHMPGANTPGKQVPGEAGHVEGRLVIVRLCNGDGAELVALTAQGIDRAALAAAAFAGVSDAVGEHLAHVLGDFLVGLDLMGHGFDRVRDALVPEVAAEIAHVRVHCVIGAGGLVLLGVDPDLAEAVVRAIAQQYRPQAKEERIEDSPQKPFLFCHRLNSLLTYTKMRWEGDAGCRPRPSSC